MHSVCTVSKSISDFGPNHVLVSLLSFIVVLLWTTLMTTHGSDDSLGTAVLYERAAAARDSRALTRTWWERSRPQQRGAIQKAPLGIEVDFHPLFEKWLHARDLSGVLEREADQEGFFVYRLVHQELLPHQHEWTCCWHGTRWYAFWSILTSCVLLPSDNREAGHDFWEPGVYCSPRLSTAREYGIPHIVFDDGVYHRVVMELRVNTVRRKRQRQRGGIQWVFPPDAIVIRAVWIEANSSIDVWEHRFVNWDFCLSSWDPRWFFSCSSIVILATLALYSRYFREGVSFRVWFAAS